MNIMDSTYKLSNLYKNFIFFIITAFFIILTSVNIANSQNDTDLPNNKRLQEAVKIINDTLATYPAQYGNSYLEITRVSVNSKGKLLLYKQYKGESNCTASREEAFLTDLEPTNITSFTKANTMVISVGCKNGIGDCVQRFFRNSCDVTFKSESYQKELLIISGTNLRNTEKIRMAFSELIAYAREESKNTNLINSPLSNSATALAIETVEKPLSSSNVESRKNKVSLTMDDVEPAEKSEENVEEKFEKRLEEKLIQRRKKINSNSKYVTNMVKRQQIRENKNVEYNKLYRVTFKRRKLIKVIN